MMDNKIAVTINKKCKAVSQKTQEPLEGKTGLIIIKIMDTDQYIVQLEDEALPFCITELNLHL